MQARAEDEGLIQTVVARAQRGDESAFTELVGLTRDRIYGWAIVRVRDRDDAEDIVQAVLIRMHRHLDGFGGRARFSTWLYRVTVNVIAEHCRKKSVRTSVPLDLAASGEPEWTVDRHDPADELAQTRAAELVRSFFRELSERQREVFHLVDLEGYAPAEVAEMLDMNRNTVRAHLLRARRTIRKKMLENHPAIVEEFES